MPFFSGRNVFFPGKYRFSRKKIVGSAFFPTGKNRFSRFSHGEKRFGMSMQHCRGWIFSWKNAFFPGKNDFFPGKTILPWKKRFFSWKNDISLEKISFSRKKRAFVLPRNHFLGKEIALVGERTVASRTLRSKNQKKAAHAQSKWATTRHRKVSQQKQTMSPEKK